MATIDDLFEQMKHKDIIQTIEYLLTDEVKQQNKQSIEQLFEEIRYEELHYAFNQLYIIKFGSKININDLKYELKNEIGWVDDTLLLKLFHDKNLYIERYNNSCCYDNNHCHHFNMEELIDDNHTYDENIMNIEKKLDLKNTTCQRKIKFMQKQIEFRDKIIDSFRKLLKN